VRCAHSPRVRRLSPTLAGMSTAMAVGIKVGSIKDEIGAPSFLHSFFSTISAHCDSGRWGSRFPLLFRLCEGRLSSQEAAGALVELRQAQVLLSSLPPSAVVWDIENQSARPPWGTNISPDITSLGNYFVSSTGRDLFALLEEALKAAEEEGQDALIE
jgi:hypothetical protein